MSESKLQVLIIGAGVSGLLLAQALKKDGIHCTVYERESSAEHSRPREWGMSIQWALPLLQDILPSTMMQRLVDATVDPSYEPPDPGELPTLNAETGELIKNMPLVKVYRVSRRKFRDLLAEGVDIQYGKNLKTVDTTGESTVNVHFEDGTSTSGSLLIGTDGARSTVRASMFGPDRSAVQNVPYSAVNLHVRYDDPNTAKFLRKWHPIYTMGIHPQGYWLWLSIQDVPDVKDPSTWVFQLQCTWKSQDGEDVTSLESLKERAKSFSDPFKTAFLNIPKDTKVYENKMAYWIPQNWDSKQGRITLLGDAAHPMTFQRGQGLNHCIADVSKLSKQLKDVVEGRTPLAKAVDEYQQEVVSRAGDEVRLSLRNTEMLHDWDMLLQSPLMQRGAAPGVPTK